MIERLTQYLKGTSFHRGLALGALVGAAIAGSTLWTRIRAARERDADRASTTAQKADASPAR